MNFEEKKTWDVSFVREIRLLVAADTEEEARAIAEGMKEPNEKVGAIIPKMEEEENE